MREFNRPACELICGKLRSLVQEERALEKEILGLMRTVYESHWYRALAYGSMIEFLVEDSGMERATAYRRVQVLGLIEKAPVVAKLLEEGKMSVSNAAQLNQAIQTETKLEKKEGALSRKVRESMREKLSTLITETQGASFREAQRIIARHLPLQAEMRATRALETPVPDGRVQLVVNITPALQAKLDEIRSLTSHIDPNPTPEPLLEHMADRALQILRKKSGASKNCPTLNTPESEGRVQEARVRKPNNPTAAHIPNSLKRAVRIESGSRCEFIDERTGRRCESTHQLEVEHVQPRVWGGTNERSNLKLYCRAHNQYAAWRLGIDRGTERTSIRV